MTSGHWISLECNPIAPLGVVRSIQVLVCRSADTELQISYRLEGDLSRLRLLSPRLKRSGMELWRQTCLEAFIAAEGTGAYHEINFAPSGEWAVYAFTSYRNRGPLNLEMSRPHLALRLTGTRLEVDTLVRLDQLSTTYPRTSLRVGISAVIATSDGISYWALRHPSARPDFHAAEGFVLRFEPPSFKTS